MPHTLAISLSDAAIRRHINDPHITQLRDPRYSLRLRFHRSRERASWYLVRGSAWHKLGVFPELTTRALLAQLPSIHAQLAAAPTAAVGVSAWETLADLLCWYRDRVATHSRLSARRKSSTKTAINKHLLPLVGGVPITDVSASLLDDELVWPLQRYYSLAYVRLILGVLKRACKQAVKLKLLQADPMAGIALGNFIKASIKPKPGALRAGDMPDLVETLRSLPPVPCFLLLMMLMFGTRISETRRAKWPDMDIPGARWAIPEGNTKSRREHRLPLTPMAITLLTRYREWQRRIGYRGVYLFPGQRGKAVSDSTAFAWVAAAGGGRWTSHDLRKLARTVWADLGVDYLVSELLLNHALSQQDRTYIHTYVERQSEAALQRWHEWLIERGLDTFLAETDARSSFYANTQRPQWWRG